MQSAPWAVTCSHHASRQSYTSSRHALAHPARYVADGTTTLSTSAPSNIDRSQHAASPVVLVAPSVRRHSGRRHLSTLVTYIHQKTTNKQTSSYQIPHLT